MKGLRKFRYFKLCILCVFAFVSLTLSVQGEADKATADTTIRVQGGKGYGKATFDNLGNSSTEFTLTAAPEGSWVFVDEDTSAGTGWVLGEDHGPKKATATNTMDQPLSSPENFSSVLSGNMVLPEGKKGEKTPWSADGDRFYIHSEDEYVEVTSPWGKEVSFQAEGGEDTISWTLIPLGDNQSVKNSMGRTFTIKAEDFTGDNPLAPGEYIVTASDKNKLSDSMILIISESITLSVEDDLTECMEGRLLTYKAEAKGFASGVKKTFIFHFKRSSGVDWTAKVKTYDNTATYIAKADKVADSPTQAQHYFSTPIYVTIDAVSSNYLNIDVYELWINKFDGGKPWKVCVGENISYEAIGSSDCHTWKWDMPEGVPDAWNPVKGDEKSGTEMKIPYSDLARASNSWFGSTYGKVVVSCYDGEDNFYKLYSTDMRGTSQKAKVYFPPNLNVHGKKPSTANPPCWFVFWNQTAAGNNKFTYNDSLPADGSVTPIVGIWPAPPIPGGAPIIYGGEDLQIGPTGNSGGAYGDVLIDDPYIGAKRIRLYAALGQPQTTVPSGIDGFHRVVGHETEHYDTYTYGSLLWNYDTDGDNVMDILEKASPTTLRDTNELISNTYNIRTTPAQDDEFRAYSYEVNVLVGHVGRYDSVDWSKSGKQW